jgi:hypothetical protein
MTTIGRLTAATVAVALGGGLGACGGDDDPKDTTAAKQAEAICAQIKAQTDAVKAPADLTKADAAKRYYEKVVPLVDAQVQQLGVLRPDEAIKDDWAQFLTRQAAARDVLHELQATAAAGRDISRADLIAKVGPAAEASTAAAKKVGAPACG